MEGRPSRERGPDLTVGLLVTSILSIVLCTIAVAIRLYTKLRYGNRKLELEDWLIIGPAYCSVTGIALTMAIATRYGLGKHMDDLGWDLEQISILLKALYAINLVLNVGLISIRCSLLLFIRRLSLTAVPWISLTCRILIVFCCIFTTVTASLSIFQCNPINSAWNPLRVQSTDCVDSDVFYSSIVIGLVIDLSIFVLPAILVSKLTIPRKKKIQSIVMFSLGGCGCIAECFRVEQLYNARRTTDASYIMARIIVVCFLQIAFGLLCCCVPSTKMFIVYEIYPKLKYAKDCFSTDRSTSKTGDHPDNQDSIHRSNPQSHDLENYPVPPRRDQPEYPSPRSTPSASAECVHPIEILGMNIQSPSEGRRHSETVKLNEIMNINDFMATSAKSQNKKEDDPLQLPIFYENEEGHSHIVQLSRSD